MDKSPQTQETHSNRHWHPMPNGFPVILGAAIGLILPIAWGCYAIAREQAYRASHPLGPNQGYCGMSGLFPFVLLFLAPISTAFGALIGWGSGLIVILFQLGSESAAENLSNTSETSNRE